MRRLEQDNVALTVELNKMRQRLGLPPVAATATIDPYVPAPSSEPASETDEIRMPGEPLTLNFVFCVSSMRQAHSLMLLSSLPSHRCRHHSTRPSSHRLGCGPQALFP
jgi:hypothetical protein